MASVPINFKTDPKVKKQAQKIASDLGFNLSSVLNGYLRHFVKTRTVHFSLTLEEQIAKEKKPTKYFLDSIREAEEDIKRGDVSPSFDNAKDAIDWLNK
jgi:addiction module RelB/DinJ family antitoxin